MSDAPVGLSTLGRCLIAAGVASSVCAVVLAERDLLRIGAFAIALPLFAALLAQLSRRTVTAQRTVLPSRVSRGDQAEAELELSYGGLLGSRLPTWLGSGRLELTDEVPDALGCSPRLTVTLSRRRSEPTTTLRYPITPAVRGRHLIGPLTVRFSDPLGMAEYDRDLAGRTALTVLPRVTPLRGLPDGLGRGEGDSGSTGLRRGPGERDAMVRVYQPGDPLRTVHWRSTARHDELMVRLEERPWHGGVTVLLDRRAQAHRGVGAQSSLEWAIELAASVCHHLIVRGRRVTLVGEDGVVLATGRDQDALLDTLALLRPTTQPGLLPGLHDEGELIAVLGAVEPVELDPLMRNWSGGHAHAVLLDVAAWTHRGAEATRATAPADRPAPGIKAPAQVLTEAGWTVLAGTPSQGPDEVWDEFCRRLPLRLRTGR
ncbi:MAG: DUF58 domain-containing protein [Actinomycetota bacterium]|nr:DUF58 domain-containing protein [Actinomycetota bacterium]